MTEEGQSKEAAFAVAVECYAGHRGEETPRSFRLGERSIDVVEVIDRWLAPDHRYFKVVDADNRRYILRHEVSADTWSLTHYDATG